MNSLKETEFDSGNTLQDSKRKLALHRQIFKLLM